jgi:hypothetical protein
MVDNPIFYKEIVPLDRMHHKSFRLKGEPPRYKFAAQSHVVPAIVDEFGMGGRTLPIVFLPGAKVPSAVFLLGMNPGDNRLIASDGRWEDIYVPAYLRRYPFIIGEVEGAESIVCIDQSSELFGTDAGQPLFDESGEETALLQDKIRFINDYLVAARRTDEFVKTMAELDLFQTVTIDVQPAAQDRRVMHGLMMIDLQKFNALPDKEFLRLRQLGFIPMVYAHLASLANLDRFALRAEAA